MADSPPPLDDVEINQEEEDVQEPPSQPEPLKEEEPLFADMEEEQEQQQPEPEPEPEPEPLPPPTLEATAAEEPPAKPVVKDTPSLVESAASKPLDLFGEEEKMEPDKKQVCCCTLFE